MSEKELTVLNNSKAPQYEIRILGMEKLNPYEELIKVFLQPSQYRLTGEAPETGNIERPGDAPKPDASKGNYAISESAASDEAGTIRLEYVYRGDADDLKRQIYRDLSRHTGKSPKWGILTGIRPVKLAYELAYGVKAGSDARRTLLEDYLLHPDKADLATEILEYQRQKAGDPKRKSLSVYIGIPFCPTRCLYCSFTSNQVGDEEIRRYLAALEREINAASEMAERDGFRIESVYMGGGTPTTLDAEQLDHLLGVFREAFGLKGSGTAAAAGTDQPLREFTVEAGRPDTITAQKLEVLRCHGIDRISINPQSMQQRTLDLIGRKHTVEQTRQAFALAKTFGFRSINADLIAGLPEEDFEDFTDSLEQVLQLGADNITLHTLAVKRASRLKEMDENFNYREEELRERMLAWAGKRLREEGFLPYYLYRQKHTSGNTENIGYCREDKINRYNIRIMEERQSILALGAGGISKIWFPEENRLERVANVSNYEIYIDRIDEMIERKRMKFFGGEKTC